MRFGSSDVSKIMFGSNEIAKIYQGIKYMPAGALSNYQAAMAEVKAETGGCNIVFIGDSIMDGYGVTNPQTKSVPGCVRAYFQSKYGDAGIGYVRSGRPNDYDLANAIIDYTGTWAAYEGFGPGKKSTITTTDGSKASMAFDGTNIGIVLATGTWVALGTITIKIDGVEHSTLDPKTLPDYAGYAHYITGLSNTSHTIEITANITEGQYIVFHGFAEIKTLNGVVVHSCGVSGVTTTSNADVNALLCSVDLWNPDLCIIDGIGNDWSQGVPLATYEANLNTIIDYIQSKGSDVILVTCGQFVSSYEGYAPVATWNEYRLKMFEIATAQGVGLIDLINAWPIKAGGNQADWAYDNSLLTDNVHPNDTGAQGLANEIVKIIDI